MSDQNLHPELENEETEMLQDTAVTPEETAKPDAPETVDAQQGETAEPAETTAAAADTDAKPKPVRRGRKKKNPEDMTPEEREEWEKKQRNKPKNVKQSAKRLLGYIGEHKAKLVFVAICVILSTTVSVLAALLIRPIYRTVQNVVQGTLTDGDAAIAYIGKYLIFLAIAYTLSAFFSLLYTRIMLNVSVKTVKKLRRDLFNHLQGLPVSWFDKRKVGEIMSHFTSDVNRVNDLVADSSRTRCRLSSKSSRRRSPPATAISKSTSWASRRSRCSAMKSAARRASAS